MDIMRVTARWTGFQGAPGYSNFFFSSGLIDGGLLGDEAQALADRVAAAFDEVTIALPSAVDIDIEPEVAIIDSDTGMATAFQGIDPPSTVSGMGTGQYSAPSGAVVNWRTDDVRFGRRIRGRTFLVPLANDAYDSDGTLSGQMAYINSFANTLRGGAGDADLGVWSRPRDGSGGVFATVTSHNVPDKAAVLRSRRD